jgi:hypothetical protein
MQGDAVDLGAKVPPEVQPGAVVSEAAGNLALTFDTGDLQALLWTSRRREPPSAWHGHVAFAHWLVHAARPDMIVELGTEHGVSYMAFCHATAVRGSIGRWRCYAVDSWAGDAHTGNYGNEVFASLNNFNQTYYAAFSTLLRMTFDEALPRFADASIDLLHIDGLHTYEAVRHDFETWLPKLSSRGVVLFHDTAIRDRGFGVWRLWHELTAELPHFEFLHSAGLGVLLVGPDQPVQLRALCAITDPTELDRTRDIFAAFSMWSRGAGLR